VTHDASQTAGKDGPALSQPHCALWRDAKGYSSCCMRFLIDGPELSGGRAGHQTKVCQSIMPGGRPHFPSHHASVGPWRRHSLITMFLITGLCTVFPVEANMRVMRQMRVRALVKELSASIAHFQTAGGGAGKVLARAATACSGGHRLVVRGACVGVLCGGPQLSD
jgi:hypothetical protein